MSSQPIWNERGLIFGPEETEENFYKRCEKALSHADTHSLTAKKLFDINPDWIQVIYSNKGLRFWEGGCTWIEEDKVVIQLNKALEHKKRFLGFYSKEELLAHELVHAVRHTFEEPIFEEILAYQTSPNKFRRFFGPIFRTSKETTRVLFLLLFFLLGVVCTPFYMFAWLGLLAFLGIGLIRLARTQKIFAKTKQKLARLTSPEKALFIMVRLNDREIIRFSKMSEKEILNYAKKMKKIHFRWQQICDSYLRDCP